MVGGAASAKKQDVPFIGELPIDPKIRAGGDAGTPIVVEDLKSPSQRSLWR